MIVPHAIEGDSLSHTPIRIGDGVTIGGYAVIMQGCTISDNATIGIGAVLSKNTHVGPGEIWVGVPAKKLNKGE